MWRKVANDSNKFKKNSQTTITNRYGSCIDDVEDKIYVGDIFVETNFFKQKFG